MIFKSLKKLFMLNSLRNKLIVSNVFLVIFTVLVLSVLLGNFIRQFAINNFKKENRLIIGVVSSMIEDLVENSYNELKMISSLEDIKTLNKRTTEEKGDLYKKFLKLKYLNNFYVLSEDGEILFNYICEFKDSFLKEKCLIHHNEKLKEKVKKLLKSYKSIVGFDKLKPGKENFKRYIIEKEGKIIQIFHPLFNSDKTVERILVGEIAFSKIGMGDAIYNIYKTTGGILSAIAYKDGTILDHTFSDELGENILKSTKKLGRLDKYSEVGSYTAESVIYRGEKYIRIAHNLHLAGNKNIMLIIYQPMRTIDDLVKGTWNKVLFAVIFSFILAIFFGIHRAVKISAPIKEITQIARDIGRGYYNKKIEKVTNDEIGSLAGVINEMAISLAGKIKELEESKRMLLLTQEEVNKNVKEIEAVNVNLKKRIDELVTISNFTETLRIKTNITDIAKYIGDILGSILGHNVFSIKVFDEKRMSLKVVEARGLSQEYLKKRKVAYIGEGVSGLAVKMGRIIEVYDMETDPRVSRNVYRGENIKSMICFPMITRGRVLGVINLYKKDEKYYFTEEEKRVISIFANQTALAIDSINLMQDIKNSYLTTISLLSSAIDARDSYTQGHSERVANLAVCIGKKLGLRDDELDILKNAGLLHDIGKIGIRDEIIRKRGKLNISEYEEMKQHPIIGSKILEKVSFLPGISTIIKHHHENYDGTGYPDGLKGDEIPFMSSILAVADAFDAMSSDRPYREAMSMDQIINELKSGANKQFDPAVVYALIDVINKDEIYKMNEHWIYKDKNRFDEERLRSIM